MSIGKTQSHKPSASLSPSRLRDMLLAQSVRLIEQDGPLEDSAAMNAAFRNHSGREDRLLERARLLAQRLKLDTELARWRDLGGYVGVALSVLVFFAAYGIATAVIGGDRTLNAVLAFLIVLGMHALTLALWGISVVTTTFSAARPPGRLSLGRLFLRLVAWLPVDRGPYSLTMMRAASGLLQREKLIPWAFGFISHAIWSLAFVLVLIALWFAFSFQEYRLTWETTILNADFFVGFVRTTGWLPQWIGFPTPDTSTLLDPGAPGADQRAWALWLIGCTLVYGLIPRVLLTGLCWLWWRRAARNIRLDTADPYFRKLLVRFDEMERSTVVDPEHESIGHGRAPHPVPVSDDHRSLAMVGFELPPESDWPPAALAPAAHLQRRIAGASNERRALLNELAQARPHKILFVCNGAASPDRGTERFLREACVHGAHCALLLLEKTSGANVDRWRSWLLACGMQQIPAFTDLDAAIAWFKPADV